MRDGSSISASSASVYNACSPVDLAGSGLDCLFKSSCIDSLGSRVLKFTIGYGGPISAASEL